MKMNDYEKVTSAQEIYSDYNVRSLALMTCSSQKHEAIVIDMQLTEVGCLLDNHELIVRVRYELYDLSFH